MQFNLQPKITTAWSMSLLPHDSACIDTTIILTARGKHTGNCCCLSCDSTQHSIYFTLSTNACLPEMAKGSLEFGRHACADLLDRRPRDQALPPRLDARVRVEHGRVRRRHEVEGEREVVQVGEAEEIAAQVPVLRQTRLVDLEHLLQLLQALVHGLLVGGGAAHDGEDDALEHDRRQGGVVLLRFDLRPDVHHGCRFDVALPQEIDLA
jgi:hypothetical protein